MIQLMIGVMKEDQPYFFMMEVTIQTVDERKIIKLRRYKKT